MRARLRDLALPAGTATVIALFLSWVGLRSIAFTDYEIEAEPSLFALRAGDLGGFLDALPAYGGSLVMRSPFAVLPDAWGGGDLALFRSMAAPCIAAGALLGIFFWRRAERLGVGLAGRLAVLGLCAGNPLTLRALEIGHPEELLGAVLCVAAALAAGAQRPLVAGALLGLAVANKPWAVVAVAPVLIMLPAGRLRALTVAAGIAAAFLVPLWLLGSSAIAQTQAAASDSGIIFQPWQIWWFLGDHGQVVTGSFGEKPGFRTPPGWLGAVARPLVVIVPLALCLALAGRMRARVWHDGLLLLALVLLLRCLLDPWNVVYYPLPFLIALVTWELHARPGLPVMSIACTLLCWVTLEQFTRLLSPDLQSVAFLAWSVPVALALTFRLASPRRFARLVRPLTAAFAALRPVQPPPRPRSVPS